MAGRRRRTNQNIIPIDFLRTAINDTDNASASDPQTYYRLLDVEDEGRFVYKNRTISVNMKNLGDIRVLGHGHFGNVMLSEVNDGTVCVQMAVKRLNLLPSTKNPHGYSTQTDLLTIRTVGSGENPHVTKFYTAFVDKSPMQLLICMEACETSMEKFYRKMHELQLVQCIDQLLKRMIKDIVDALSFLKTHNILHRDVKPSNILINQDPIIFKLCDFGICSPLIDSQAASNTRGTQIYLAPERIDGTLSPRGYGIRSDMWSLGLSIIEIATSRHPFHDQNQLGRIAGSQNWTPDLPSSLSIELQQLILLLLKINPTERPQSYQEIQTSSALQNLPDEITNDEIQTVKVVIENLPKANDITE